MHLENAKLAVLDTFGVKFFASQNADPKQNSRFFPPFFRDGIVEAVQIDKFYKMLKANEDIRVVKSSRYCLDTATNGSSSQLPTVFLLLSFL